MQFGQGVVAEGWRLLGEAFLGVGDHDALANAAEHVVHDQKDLVTVFGQGHHHHLADAAGKNATPTHARPHLYHICERFGGVQQNLGL